MGATAMLMAVAQGKFIKFDKPWMLKRTSHSANRYAMAAMMLAGIERRYQAAFETVASFQPASLHDELRIIRPGRGEGRGQHGVRGAAAGLA